LPTQAVSEDPAGSTIAKIEVRIQVGNHRMAASDDPLFLCLCGPQGREFRLKLAKGPCLRRGGTDHYVLAAADSPEVNVDFAELNDPCSPPLDLAGVERVSIRKGLNPIPNVRGVGEMDDRLEIEEVEVLIQAAGSAAPVRFSRRGPHWLGLVCGLGLELARSS
jgi:hypothetical protein